MLDISFLSSVAVIAADPARSRPLFLEALGLPLVQHDTDDYFSSEAIPGCRHFGVWPLSQAAEACFGTPEWPADSPVPQASIEFDVADQAAVEAAAAELETAGYLLLHPPRTEPWGQTVVRVQSADGVIVGVSYAPWMHQEGSQQG